ncbi:hypothetical protein ACHQM5_001282 [Ranunculus cassubicifolius]
MAKLTLTILLILSILSLTSIAHSATTPSPSPFIKSSCSLTRYPALCIKSLSSYASTIQESPKEIAEAALTVSLSSANSAKAYVIQMSKSIGLKGREYQVMKDCVETVADSVDRLSMSIGELRHMGTGEQSFIWHMSNVQTWVSAAETDENTCMDGFAGHAMDGKLKTSIKSKLLHVIQVTSNALALVNRFAERH